MGDTSTTLSHWGAFEVTVDDGKVVGVEGVGIDPDPSPIGQHLLRAHDDRILAPAVRRSWIESGPFAAPDRRGLDSYVDVSWDEALDLAAQVVNTIRAEHGNQAIFGGSYGWASAGRFHHAPSQLKRFLNCVGGFVNSVGTYSHGAIEVVGPAIIGLDVQAFQRASTPITEIVERTELLVSFGGFPAQNSQIASGGDAVHWYRPELRKAAANGCRFVAITPSLGEFDAELGAEWLPIRPGTDAALMLGLAGELVARDLHATRFLQSRCSGADQLLAYLDGSFDGIVRNAEWAANICGLDAAAVSALALDVATTRSVVNAMWSTQRVEHGEQAVWSLIALGCVIGQLDQPGAGIAAGLGSLGSVSEARSAQYLPYLPQGPNPVDVRIPVARIADALLNPGDEYWFQGDRFRYPDIELVWWCGGNPFHHHQDLNRLDEAWKKPKAIIVNEPFWTSTAQRADIIFPATIGIERNDFGGTRTGPHLVSMEQAIEPPGEAQHDYLTFSALARSGSSRTVRRVLARPQDEPAVDAERSHRVGGRGRALWPRRVGSCQLARTCGVAWHRYRGPVAPDLAHAQTSPSRTVRVRRHARRASAYQRRGRVALADHARRLGACVERAGRVLRPGTGGKHRPPWSAGHGEWPHIAAA